AASDVLAFARVRTARDQPVRRARLPRRSDEGWQPGDRAGAARALPLPRRRASRVVGRTAGRSLSRVRDGARVGRHGTAMNFLAHFLVADDDEELRLGSLLGDVVKGRVERYDHPGTTDGIRAGIRLHRAVDSFSDAHDAVRRSRQRLVPAYGHMAGVLVDVFYDHVLARTWAEHHAAPLPAFARDVYRTLRDNLPRLPREAHALVRAMTGGDWLTRYASLAGIDGTLREMAHR